MSANPPAPGPFTGFPTGALGFYAGLEADNSKAYWTDHKAQWEREVREPMLALVDALEDEFGEAKLFRPNRDIRFSADKSPYKTHLGAFVAVEPASGYYVEISAGGLRAGGGFRAHSTAQTASLRRAVDASASGLQLESLLEGLRRKQFEVHGEQVRTTPRGYAADHPRIETLRYKELMVIRDFGDPDWLATKSALTRVRDTWRATRPLNEWVAEHVGRA
ncbi:DUF2461 domain-containing protein [Terrabacter terrigena]|uniref:DUF2461 domain-containing protein n=1 Tax=Terrabacter terrigena TaxID=574718 RepID=A0ABW3N0S9_9MICO